MIDSLVIGNGEIGSAIFNVLDMRKFPTLTCFATDIKDDNFNEIVSQPARVLHICFPYSRTFVDDVVKYASQTQAELVIIHSTVKVGTSKLIESRIDNYVVHSPVQGQHPDLTDSILHFKKLVGTWSDIAFEDTKREFPNIDLIHIKNSDATELGKMLSTSYYGVCIAWHRDMKKMCDKFDVDFDDTVTVMNRVYNEGYEKFKPDVRRPILTPPTGSIGGHCVVQNARLLEEQVQSEFLSLIV